ncbi:MAG: hypothetical protein KA140_02955 [Caldisericia bacterium]|nr:hypothetical protein [Caldisericia bacterium]
MKLKPYMVIGILFVVVFLGVTLIGHAIGFWNLPGQNPESEHTEEAGGEKIEGENHEEPATSGTETELHGYMNLKEYLENYGTNLECVAAKIGVTVEELNIEARELSHSKNFEMEEIQEFAKECKEQAQTTNNNIASIPNQGEAKDEKGSENADGNSNNSLSNKDISEIINELGKVDGNTSDKIKKALEEARNKGEVPIPGDLEALPYLKGSDNLKQYCSDNNINMDCLAQKLGIPVSEFDDNAKDVAAKTTSGHVEEIRELLTSCIDYTR